MAELAPPSVVAVFDVWSVGHLRATPTSRHRIRNQFHPGACKMTEQHPTYFLAATIAILVAVALRLVGAPAPWPPAIAMYVYGLVAWPVLRHKMPTVRPLAYTAIWIGAALLVFVYEGLGAYAGK
jgi:hypothetical protein